MQLSWPQPFPEGFSVFESNDGWHPANRFTKASSAYLQINVCKLIWRVNPVNKSPE